MLEIEGLRKKYPMGAEALRQISLKIEPGEFVAVLGSSGSGKSTLLRTINRLVEPTAGTIVMDGKSVTGASPSDLRFLRRKIAMIFQEFNLIDRVTVLTNVLSGSLGRTSPLWGWMNRFSRKDQSEAMVHLRRMGLAEKWNQRADRLSGGQRQRVGIARALMQRPKLLLADEPVASLDPGASHSIMELLRDINRRDGVTVISNLHAPELARQYATRVIGLKMGELVLDRSPDQLEEAALSALYDEEN